MPPTSSPNTPVASQVVTPTTPIPDTDSNTSPGKLYKSFVFNVEKPNILVPTKNNFDLGELIIVKRDYSPPAEKIKNQTTTSVNDSKSTEKKPKPIAGSVQTGGCGKATSDNVNTIYPRSTQWLKGPQAVICPITNTPTISVNLSEKKIVRFVRTLATYQEYITNAEVVINTITPNATIPIKKRVLASALAVAIREQGSEGRIKGFNNNLTGTESSGFKVFDVLDVNGRVQATEGGTKKVKFYYSFTTLRVGLVPLISKICQRNMFAQSDDPNQWAWRYYRDWNGYGARTLPTYKSGEINDCTIISGNESIYKTALSAVNKYSTFK